MDASLAMVGVGLTGLVLVAWVVRRMGTRSRERLEVVFELELPSKWAAELTAQALDNEDIPCRIQSRGNVFRCCVTKALGSDRGQVDRICRKLDQIAGTRGGGCVAHRMRLGSRVEVFEH